MKRIIIYAMPVAVALAFSFVLAGCAGSGGTPPAVLSVSLVPAVDWPDDGDVKATTFTSAALLNTSGNTVENATATGGTTAKFPLSGVANGDYFIEVNGDADDLVPTIIDDHNKPLVQQVGTQLRMTYIGNPNSPTYYIRTFSKGQGSTDVVKFSDGSDVLPARYGYFVEFLKTSPLHVEMHVLGTAALLTQYTATLSMHPGRDTGLPYTSVPTQDWLLNGDNDHCTVVENYGTGSCLGCHGSNLTSHPASYTDITNTDGHCFRCHHGPGGPDSGLVDPTQ